MIPEPALPEHLTSRERTALLHITATIEVEYASRVRFLALFGSKARGDFATDSDLDLLIVTDTDDWSVRETVRKPAYDAIVDHDVYVSPRVIGLRRLESLRQRRPGYFRNLCEDAIELWRRPGTANPLRLSASRVAA